ncbi:MAG: hypothetical protein GY765_04935 [bacterium]|nr:hypothetical protein [bacterium]
MKRKNLQMKYLLPLLAVLLLLVPSFQSAVAPDQKPEFKVIKAGHAPTPFLPSQIRNGCPEGRKIVFQVESFGKALMFQSIEFLTCQESKVVFELVTKGVDGKQMGSRKMTTGTWQDLQSHASYPKTNTIITSESYTTPAGTFDCLLYTVTGESATKRFWFAKEMPGPPLAFEEISNDKVTMKMVMLKTGLKK